MSPKMLRLGFVGLQPRDAPIYRAFEARMAELGYREGKNFAFDFVEASDIEAYQRIFGELAARKVDIMMAVGNEPALRAAREAAGSTPIVFLAIDFDPLAKGFVKSLARPGSNITGIPHARDAASRDQAEAAAGAATKLGFTPDLIAVTDEPPDYVGSLKALDDAPGEPVVIPASPLFLRDRMTLEGLLLARRIPLDQRLPRACRGRRADELRHRSYCALPRHRGLCGSDREGYQSRRTADSAVIAFSSGGQSQDRSNARHCAASSVHGSRRRSDRMTRREVVRLRAAHSTERAHGTNALIAR
jgi:hypothetical protein